MADVPPLAGVFRLPFNEQIAFFRAKLGNLVPTQRWDDMLRQSHDRGFMVAGAMQADLLADLAEAVDRGIAQGTTLDEFERDFEAIVARHGWTGWTGEGNKKGRAWRMRTIFMTNVRTSYAAGRFAQLTAAGFAFWVYRHGGSQEPRPEHVSWDGVALPPEHPFWETHYPPSDWGCSCSVAGARTASGVRRLGGDPGKTLPGNWKAIDPATGAPIGIGKGWDYAPGRSVAAMVSAIADKMPRYPAMLGAQLGASIAPMIAEGWRERLAAIRAGEVQKPVLLGTIGTEDIAALESRGIAPASAEMMISPGVVAGPKAERHLAKGDALDDATWEALPELLRRPLATLYDVDSKRLMLVLKGTDRFPQIVVHLDMRLRHRKAEQTTNLIKSAYLADMRELRGRVINRKLTLLRGSLEE